MHWLGKTSAVLLVIAALACTVLTAKLISVRNSWTRKTQDFASKYETTAAKLQETRRQTDQLRDEVETGLREWGFTWNGIPTQVSGPAEGKLTVDIGTNHRVREQQVLHGFEMQADGSVIYRGSFVVATAQADRSALNPTWRVRPEDVSTWQSGRWRWRSLVPSAHEKRSMDQALSFMNAEETLNDRRSTLQIQEKLIREAQAQRKQRVAELVGGDELAQDPSLLPEFRQGLVGTLAEVEEARNKVLLENDDLRRKVRQTRDAVERLQQQNEQLVQKLPQPQPQGQVSRRD
jgi:hypothetical protein